MSGFFEGRVDLTPVGGDNLPEFILPSINETKASMMLLDLYYAGSIGALPETQHRRHHASVPRAHY